MKPAILCVDDEIDNVEALERTFRKSYSVMTATSGPEALKILEKHEVAVIISDQRMPLMTGVEFLKKSIFLCPDTIRILLTGYSDINSVIEAINTGQVYRYITKPWDIHDLQSTVARAVERYQMHKELQQKTEDLKKAYENLKSLDKAKSQFMLLIHHELRTPLTIISNFLELLNQSHLNQDQSLYCEKIQSGANRLQELIFSVLEIMEAETGRIKPVKASICLKPLAEDLVKQMTLLAEKKSQVFQLNILEDLVYADQVIIEKVLRRLLHNAIEFADPNTTVIVQTTLKTSQSVEVAITNSGPTLSPEVIEHILKPFALNENSMHHSKGMGLGLNLCQALLKCHDSKLEIVSQNNTTQVSFILSKYGETASSIEQINY